MSQGRCRTAAWIACAATLTLGCDREGTIEIAWRLVDREGDSIFPGGLFAPGRADDTCALPGRVAERDVAFELAMVLSWCRACDDDACDEPCDEQAFSCATHRGSLTIAADDQPYLFTLEPRITVADDSVACTDPRPACLAVPGPRERHVRDGLITDLQVYQLVLDVDVGVAPPLSLEACGCA